MGISVVVGGVSALVGAGRRKTGRALVAAGAGAGIASAAAVSGFTVSAGLGAAAGMVARRAAGFAAVSVAGGAIDFTASASQKRRRTSLITIFTDT